MKIYTDTQKYCHNNVARHCGIFMANRVETLSMPLAADLTIFSFLFQPLCMGMQIFYLATLFAYSCNTIQAKLGWEKLLSK